MTAIPTSTYNPYFVPTGHYVPVQSPLSQTVVQQQPPPQPQSAQPVPPHQQQHKYLCTDRPEVSLFQIMLRLLTNGNMDIQSNIFNIYCNVYHKHLKSEEDKKQ